MILKQEADIEPEMICSIDTPIARKKLVLENRKYAFDIYFDDLEHVLNAKKEGEKTDLIKELRNRKLEDLKNYKRGQPIARFGKPVNENVLETIYKLGHPSIPVLLNEKELVEKNKKIVTPKVAPYHYANKALMTYRSMRERFIRLSMERKKNLERLVKEYKSEMGEDFSIVSSDWKIIHDNLVKGVLEDYDKLSLIQIEDKLLREHGIKEPYLQVGVLSVLLGKKLGLSDKQLEVLSLSSLLNNIGEVLYSMKIEGPVDVNDEVKKYLENSDDIFNQETIIKEMKNDPTFLPYFLRNKFEDFASEHYRKATNFNYLHSIHKNIPLYSIILLSDNAGNPVRPLTIDHLLAIYEHNFNEDGTLDDSLNNIMYDYSLEKETEKVFKTIGIDRNTKFIGRTYKKDKNTKELEDTSKVLHIVTKYLSLLDKAKKENAKDPYQIAIAQMYKEAGKQIDGAFFETFFNELIPQKYYPDGLVLKISEKNSLPFLKAHAGCCATLKTSDEGKQFLVVYTDRKGNKLQFQDITPKPMEELTGKGHKIYFKIGDWTAYYKNGFDKKIK